MRRKSRRATRFRRTLELGGSAPQTPREGLGNPSPKLSTKSGQPQTVPFVGATGPKEGRYLPPRGREHPLR
jgi:hypothetical protein